MKSPDKPGPGSHRNPPKGEDWREDWARAGVLATSARQRAAVLARDKGRCAGCGQPTTKWQADHVRPLHNLAPSVLADYPACLRFWSIENLQTLGMAPCRCHQEKSAAERTANAKVLRIIKKREAPKVNAPPMRRVRGAYKPPKEALRRQAAFKAKQKERARAWRRQRWQSAKAAHRMGADIKD